jgi:hypothetical protein
MQPLKTIKSVSDIGNDGFGLRHTCKQLRATLTMVVNESTLDNRSPAADAP